MPVPPEPDAGYEAARAAAAWVDLSARDVFRLEGSERVEFLQGMCTNDVAGLAPGGSLWAAFLTAKGAMVGDGRVLRRADDLVVDTEPGMGAPVREFLERHLISEDAALVPGDDLAVLAVVGPRRDAVVATLPPEQVLARLVGFLAAETALLVPKAAMPRLRDALGTTPELSAGAYDVLRVEEGVPRFGADMTDATIPLEANLQRALHFQKGCYVGQEVIARATYRGHMNRKLVGLLLGDAAPPKGDELRKGDRKVGWVTSVVRSPARGQQVALGYVHRDHQAPGTELDLASGGRAVVAALPLAP